MNTLALGMIVLTGVECRRTSESEPLIVAVRAESPPKVDGLADDPVWVAAPESRLLPGPSGELQQRITIRAAFDNDSVYFLLSWLDPSPAESDCADLIFPVRGGFEPDPTSSQNEEWEVWRWQAKQNAVGGNATHETRRFIHGPKDYCQSTYIRTELPQAEKDAEQGRGAGDLHIGQSFTRGRRMIEFTRRLAKDNADQIGFDISRAVPMGISVSCAEESFLDDTATRSSGTSPTLTITRRMTLKFAR